MQEPENTTNFVFVAPKPESFTKQLAKSFAISTATSFGVFAGLAAVGYIIGAADKRRNSKMQDSQTTASETSGE